MPWRDNLNFFADKPKWCCKKSMIRYFPYFKTYKKIKKNKKIKIFCKVIGIFGCQIYEVSALFTAMWCCSANFGGHPFTPVVRMWNKFWRKLPKQVDWYCIERSNKCHHGAIWCIWKESNCWFCVERSDRCYRGAIWYAGFLAEIMKYMF